MSYEGGGFDQRVGGDFGHAVTPMALDVAALQALYGKKANNTGNTVYKLGDTGAALDADGSDGSVSIGRAFYCIWDAKADGTNGGTDEIQYAGSNNALINLNDATLSTTDDAVLTALIDLIKDTQLYEELPNTLKTDLTDAGYHAGGFFSYVFDAANNVQLGGYSIANGVQIEKATGGNGNDALIGNEQDNTLKGNGGKDLVAGGAGKDSLDGGAGDDELVGGAGDDTIEGGTGEDIAYFAGNCSDYEIEKTGSTVTITYKDAAAPNNDGTDKLTNVEKAHFKNSTIDLTEDDPGCPPTDFIFLVDLSGSFSDDLANFQASARALANSVKESDPEARFALASFVDLPVDPYGSEGDYTYRAELPLTDSVEAFEAALDGLTIFDGGDYPEAQYVGLLGAATGTGLSLREDSQKIILMATDAPPHSAADYGLNEGDIQQFLDEQGITVGGIPGIPTGGRAVTKTTPSGGPSDDVLPDEREPGDPGYDTELPDPDSGLDLMTSIMRDLFTRLSAQPIFASTSDAIADYEAIKETIGFGSAVEISSDSSDLTDALRVALAEIAGDELEKGTGDDDTLEGSDTKADNIFGLGGDDTISGLGLDDELDGGSGDDTLNGNAGNDSLLGGTDADTLNGGDGNDELDGGFGIDVLDGGAGIDTADYRDVTDPVSVVLNGATVAEVNIGFFAEDTVVNVENVIGGGGDDELTGDALDNRLAGLEGEDTLAGGGGNDLLTGGDDIDTLDGGDGVDTVDFSDEAAPVVLALKGATSVQAKIDGQLADFIANFENAIGGSGNDVLKGDKAANRLEGRAGNDNLNGGGGKDVLVGGLGQDKLKGGSGRDYFDFDDIAHIGLGAKTCDRILDLGDSDRIDLKTIDANTIKPDDQKFKWIGERDFREKAGELRVDFKKSYALVSGDRDGDGEADFHLRLDRVDALSKGDFVL
jgi:Ca2+-binding RTX toxin-like protein